MRIPVSAAVATLILISFVHPALSQSSGSFVATGNMTTPRSGHAATLLQDGRVLITGGYFYSGSNITNLASAEIYAPSTGTFSPTGSMTTAREMHSATLLADGRVMIAGGQQYDLTGSKSTNLASAELYDPDNETFTPTGNMSDAQSGHTATLLNDGNVFISGGIGIGTNLGIDPRAELFDPATGVFSRVDIAGAGSKAAPLFDGRILIAGGFRTSVATLYDPPNNSLETLGFMARSRLAAAHTTSLLPTGKVLIAGGYEADTYAEEPLEHAELYDPVNGTFQTTASLLNARYGHTATLLPSGLLLIAGGYPSSTAELFNPYTENFSATGRMIATRAFHTATLLRNGTVLFTGGGSGASVELDISPLAPNLTFDRVAVSVGESFTATFSGMTQGDGTYYDVRFHAPGDGGEHVSINWQRGLSTTHTVAAETATGVWTVTGVRAHQNIDDHTAAFVPVSSELLVTR